MAIQGKNGKIHGKINNIVYRGYGDKQVIQTAPKRIKQTVATKLHALEFGLASIQAKALRDTLHHVYQERDGRMALRLNTTVAACIRTSQKEIGERDLHDADLSALNGFQFNTKAPFEKLLAVKPIAEIAADGRIQVRLPPFNPAHDIVYPPDDERRNPSFVAAVIAINFRDSYVQLIDRAAFDFENTEQVAEINWSCDRQLPERAIVIVMFSLRYFSRNWVNQRTLTTNSAFYPSIVLHAFHVSKHMAKKGIVNGLNSPVEEQMPTENKTSYVMADIERLKNG